MKYIKPRGSSWPRVPYGFYSWASSGSGFPILKPTWNLSTTVYGPVSSASGSCLGNWMWQNWHLCCLWGEQLCNSTVCCNQASDRSSKGLPSNWAGFHLYKWRVSSIPTIKPAAAQLNRKTRAGLPRESSVLPFWASAKTLNWRNTSILICFLNTFLGSTEATWAVEKKKGSQGWHSEMQARPLAKCQHFREQRDLCWCFPAMATSWVLFNHPHSRVGFPP